MLLLRRCCCCGGGGVVDVGDDDVDDDDDDVDDNDGGVVVWLARIERRVIRLRRTRGVCLQRCFCIGSVLGRMSPNVNENGV